MKQYYQHPINDNGTLNRVYIYRNGMCGKCATPSAGNENTHTTHMKCVMIKSHAKPSYRIRYFRIQKYMAISINGPYCTTRTLGPDLMHHHRTTRGIRRRCPCICRRAPHLCPVEPVMCPNRTTRLCAYANRQYLFVCMTSGGSSCSSSTISNWPSQHRRIVDQIKFKKKAYLSSNLLHFTSPASVCKSFDFTKMVYDFNLNNFRTDTEYGTANNDYDIIESHIMLSYAQAKFAILKCNASSANNIWGSHFIS